MLVLTDGASRASEAGEVVLGCLQLTYIPGLGRTGRSGLWWKRYGSARTGGAPGSAPS